MRRAAREDASGERGRNLLERRAPALKAAGNLRPGDRLRLKTPGGVAMAPRGLGGQAVSWRQSPETPATASSSSASGEMGSAMPEGDDVHPHLLDVEGAGVALGGSAPEPSPAWCASMRPSR